MSPTYCATTATLLCQQGVFHMKTMNFVLYIMYRSDVPSSARYGDEVTKIPHR